VSTFGKSSAGWGCATLFALPFAAVGVFMTAWMWKDVRESRHILANWAVVPAVIESADLKKSRGSKGGTSYEAAGAFSYVYEGRAYRSERVSISGGADNVGDYQHTLHRRMKSALQSGRKLDCRVNPADPAQAVLNAEWRPEMALFRAVFGVAFGGFGLSVLAGVVFAFFTWKRERRFKILHPQEPWLWRDAWRTPVIEARLGGGMIAAVAVLAWINITTWPLWSAVRPAWTAEGGAFKWLLSVALALVVVASAFCLRVIIHARKYRGARLDVGSLPLRPGAPVEARLYLPQALPLGAVLKMTLVSERSVTTGSGKQRRTTRTKLWSHEEEQTGPLAPRQEVVFRCRLPDDAEETVLETPENGVTWRFEARADVPGVDLKLDFELPVYRGPKTT
jgi:hypothetical protein